MKFTAHLLCDSFLMGDYQNLPPRVALQINVSHLNLHRLRQAKKEFFIKKIGSAQ
jgi:hypothetical protein